MSHLIRLAGISKSFAGRPVLQDVDFDVREGEVHALLGENGAGKSTLIKIMGGAHAPDSGIIMLEDKPCQFASPREAQRAGISTVHQELSFFAELTVAENIFLGHAPRTRVGSIDWTDMRRRSRALLHELDSGDLDIDAPMKRLSIADRQRVEIAKAMSRNARLLIMDEPTAALGDGDARRLIDVVKGLQARGVAIVYVSHRLPEIFALADRVTVLRDGRHIATAATKALSESRLVSMMVGRDLATLFHRSAKFPGETVLELKSLCRGNRVRDVTLALRAGQITGLAGLVGSGRTELALTVFGIAPAQSGRIAVLGKEVRIGSPRQARDLGISYVPEDRGQQGLVRRMSVAKSVSMAVLDRLGGRSPLLPFAKEKTLAARAIERFKVRASGLTQIVNGLSGGNQQKVVLAKWLETDPKILIIDEPTRGIDVGAKAEIHALMDKLAHQGMAILMISSDLPEVLGVSDRILVMSCGRIVADLGAEEASAEAVGTAMTAMPVGVAA
ncbi:sugar ABC transporter ATP-binding protein [Mesorhizobium sp. M0208]|uniref:sugar ABC transporter ATP-binding protein n=1 Tax=Mesorhizobium sp. M0208 TaxID=2956916 RepID=UPI00333AABD8